MCVIFILLHHSQHGTQFDAVYPLALSTRSTPLKGFPYSPQYLHLSDTNFAKSSFEILNSIFLCFAFRLYDLYLPFKEFSRIRSHDLQLDPSPLLRKEFFLNSHTGRNFLQVEHQENSFSVILLPFSGGLAAPGRRLGQSLNNSQYGVALMTGAPTIGSFSTSTILAMVKRPSRS